MRACAVVNNAFIELRFQDTAVLAASPISPAKDRRGRPPALVDADQAVPKRTRRDSDDLARATRSFSENGVDGGDDLIERFVGVELIAPVFGRVQ